MGPGTVPAAAAELLAAGINPNVGAFRLAPAATEIELHLTRWLAGRFGLPDTAAGLVLTGGAMANFVALKCARDDRLGVAVREAGVAAAGPVALYASTEAHIVIRRAADMLGLGAGAVRAIPVDEDHRMQVGALEAAVAADVAAGVRPLALCATGGSTTTGSIDPLPELADVAAAHGMWFHVDAAYGGPVVLADELAPLLAASSAPTRSPSTRTSGSTRRNRPASCWCASSACSAARSTPRPPTSGSTRPPATASTSPCTGRSSAAASRR